MELTLQIVEKRIQSPISHLFHLKTKMKLPVNTVIHNARTLECYLSFCSHPPSSSHTHTLTNETQYITNPFPCRDYTVTRCTSGNVHPLNRTARVFHMIAGIPRVEVFKDIHIDGVISQGNRYLLYIRPWCSKLTAVIVAVIVEWEGCAA